jgi:hypothetical protein
MITHQLAVRMFDLTTDIQKVVSAKVVAEEPGKLEQRKTLAQVAQFLRNTGINKRHHEITVSSRADSCEQVGNHTGNTRVSSNRRQR